MSSTSFELE
jgi:hypothetical protein